MPRRSLSVALGALGAPVALAALAAGALPAQAPAQEKAWTTHTSAQGGFRIDHPDGWTHLEARPRQGSGPASVAETLYPGELHKVTFRETGDQQWPGSLQVRIAPNPGHLSPLQWMERSDCPDCAADGEARAPIDGREAMIWDLWQLDAVLYGVVIADGDRMVEISYDLSSANDPDVDRHEAIYKRMIDSFRFVQD